MQCDDPVLSFDTQERSFVESTVEAILERRTVVPRWMVVINQQLTVSADQAIYVADQDEYQVASILHLGQMLQVDAGVDTWIRRLECVSCVHTTYAVRVRHEPHNYFANGILVHNGGTVGRRCAPVGKGALHAQGGDDLFADIGLCPRQVHNSQLAALSEGGVAIWKGWGGSNLHRSKRMTVAPHPHEFFPQCKESPT